jgi:hypothetical protein
MTTTEPIREQTELQLPTLQELSASITELRPLPAAALAILRITEHDRILRARAGHNDLQRSGADLQTAEAGQFGLLRLPPNDRNRE